MDMICEQCGKNFELYKGEYNRVTKSGRQYFFCSLSCAAKHRNARRPRQRRPVVKTCPFCGEKFETMTGAKEATFCSRSCASRGSITEKRREATRKSGKKIGLINCKFLAPAEVRAASLRTREWWKYADLAMALEAIGESFTFEFPFRVNEQSYIFDLALHNHSLLVEFDGEYHQSSKQHDKDVRKDQMAQDQGWEVMRIPVLTGQPVPISVVEEIVDRG